MKSIGVSNFSPEKIQEWFSDARIFPAVNQVPLLSPQLSLFLHLRITDAMLAARALLCRVLPAGLTTTSYAADRGAPPLAE